MLLVAYLFIALKGWFSGARCELQWVVIASLFIYLRTGGWSIYVRPLGQSLLLARVVPIVLLTLTLSLVSSDPLTLPLSSFAVSEIHRENSIGENL